MCKILLVFCLLHCSESFAKTINGELVIRGDWIVKQPVVVGEEGKLVISAGSSVFFELEPGVDITGITVHGRIFINGTEKRPVILMPKGDDGGVSALKIESDAESEISFAHFKNFLCSLHVHFSRVTVEHCLFTGNTAGIKFRAGRVVIQDNSFIDNVTAMRFWYANPVVVGNRFINNQTGIFIRGGVTSPIIAGNTMHDEKYDIKLAENQEHDIDARNNQWRSNETDEITRYIYDKRKSNYIGLVKISPVIDNRL